MKLEKHNKNCEKQQKLNQFNANKNRPKNRIEHFFMKKADLLCN